MIDLKFLNEAIRVTDGNEFRVLYMIANTLGRKGGRSVIYREEISDDLGIEVRTVSRITNNLVSKGLLKKDIVSNGNKKRIFYSLGSVIPDKNDTINPSIVDSNDTINPSIVHSNVPFRGNSIVHSNDTINPSIVHSNVPFNKNILNNNKLIKIPVNANANAAIKEPHYTEPLIDKNLCTVVNNASNKNKCSNIEPHYKEPNTGNTYVNYGYNEPLCKEPNIGNKEIEQQENKGAANAALHASYSSLSEKTVTIEQLQHYVEVKINELKKRYYTIEDLDEFEDSIYDHIDKFNLEGKEELKSYVQNSIGNMRCDLMFGSSMVCESIEGATITKVF